MVMKTSFVKLKNKKEIQLDKNRKQRRHYSTRL